ncbi:hypothetical protein [Brevundimonas sp.]|uniref:hypothetical protein n=1 Tax=Brevundimonas sp. TaxID=1871086 RepID=UPI002D2798CD|nr:hypothetical protein [Brevundimonas sp.]HYC98075.1 hypothetical protein [Brevundimonas sp.]
MTLLHTAEECRQKVRDLIAEAVREPDQVRREGLLGLADQWMAASRRRRANPPFGAAQAHSANPQGS